MTETSKFFEPLKLVSTQSTKAIIELLKPELEAQLGVKILTQYVGVSILKKAGTSGINADIFVGPSEVVDQYVQERKPQFTDRRHIAVSRSGAAFKAGVAVPDISTSSGFLDYLKTATTIAYSDGISGDHLVKVLQQYSMADSVILKRVKPAPGVSAAIPVALGLAEIGVQQISEMISVQGVMIVELPEEFRRTAAYDAVAIGQGDRMNEKTAVLNFFTSDRFQEALAGVALSRAQGVADGQCSSLPSI